MSEINPAVGSEEYETPEHSGEEGSNRKKKYSSIRMKPFLISLAAFFGSLYLYGTLAFTMRLLPMVQNSEEAFTYGLTNGWRLREAGFHPMAFMATALIVMSIGWLIWAEIQRSKKNLRPKEEHGSAKNAKLEEAKVLAGHDRTKDILLSKNIRLDMNTRNTNLNDNVMVIGDSGSWKTMSYVKPNLLQMHSNYVVLDPKGSVAEEVGNALKVGGYDIRYLNLVDMGKSMGYNPFHYFFEPNDIQKFVVSLIENTTSKEKTGGDDFFVKAEQTFIVALVFFVQHVFKDTAEQNFNTVMDLLLLAEAKEEQGADTFKSELDLLFEQLEKDLAECRDQGATWEEVQFGELAVKNYKMFKMSAGKTAKSILVSVGVRLSVFNLPGLKNILKEDELHLERIGTPLVMNKNAHDDLSKDITRSHWESLTGRDYEKIDPDQLRKTVLFVIISDSDRTFSFLASIILQQVYDQLYRAADGRKDHALPIHTRIINDEFATTGKQLDIDIKTATMRSRNISASFIVQGLSQLKGLYEKQWEAIFENCSTTLFLGGKGPTTTEMLSKLIGNETVIYKSKTVSKGRSGGYSETDQIYQRPLYGADEINRIPTNHCLVHIRGRQIFEDEKYTLMDHPNIEKTIHGPDGEANRFDVASYRELLQPLEIARSRSIDDLDHDDYEHGYLDENLYTGAAMIYINSSQLEETIDDLLLEYEIKNRRN